MLCSPILLGEKKGSVEGRRGREWTENLSSGRMSVLLHAGSCRGQGARQADAAFDMGFHKVWWAFGE